MLRRRHAEREHLRYAASRDKEVGRSGAVPGPAGGGQKAEAAGADTVFLPGDKLTVFGRYSAVCRVFGAEERFE